MEGIRNEATSLGEVVKSGPLRSAGSVVPSIGGITVLRERGFADMGKEDIPIR